MVLTITTSTSRGQTVRPSRHNRIIFPAASLSLEHEERLVMALQQVKEENAGGLVCDGRCEALASHDVPSGGLILQLSVCLDLCLNLTAQVLVDLMLLSGLLAY